jgi:hypothetical protein
VAWFWHVSPPTVLELELADFLEWERHAFRIAEAHRRAVDGDDRTG